MPEAEFMTIKEASKYLKCSEIYLYQLRARNKIPCHYLGGKVLFTKKELTEWIMSGQAKGVQK